MMDQQELAYLDGRASQEFQAAQQASSAVAARPHYSMAVRYLEMAEALKRRLGGEPRRQKVSAEPK